MVTTTTVYNFQKPAVAGDEDQWGTYLNNNIDKYESILTGNTTITSLVITTADINGGTLDNVVIGGTTAAAVTGTTISGTSFVSTGNMTFGDNDKAIFGAGSDLQIYSDGANSIIHETDGTGNLLIRASNINLQNSGATATLAQFIDGGKSSLRYNGSEKLATTSTGIDVTGTVTADGLTVDGVGVISNTNAGATGGYLWLKNLDLTTNSKTALLFTNTTNSTWQSGRIELNRTASGQEFNFYGNGNKNLTIQNNGDISFYEDTGTTAKFFWDASAESLGIGTTSPERPLHVSANPPIILLEDTGGATNDKRGQINVDTGLFQISARNDDNSNRTDILTADLGTGNVGVGTTSPSCKLHISGGSGARSDVQVTYDALGTGSGDGAQFGIQSAGAYLWNFENSSIYFATNNTERLRIDSTGNVGVGTSSPETLLHLEGGAGSASMKFDGNGTGAGRIDSTFGIMNFHADVDNENSYSYMTFNNHGSERMRIDSSGNLLVGKTTTAASTDGVALLGTNGINASRGDANVLTLNRNTSDGAIATFVKDGSVVGSIGNRATQIYIETPTKTGLDFAGDILPRYNGSLDNGVNVDLGSSGYRFKDLYLSGGVYLGGTGAANQLDDYEEGTWTPYFTQSLTNPTVTYTNTSGFYTKIGRLVHASCRIQTNTVSGGSGDLYLNGLPFAAQNISGATDMFTASLGVVFGGWSSTAAPQTGFITPTESRVKLYTSDSADARDEVDSKVTSVGAGNGLIMNVVYMTT